MGRTLARVAVVAMVGMWAYVLYLAIGPGRQDSPDRLQDRTFPTAAESRCDAALDRIGELPLSIEADSAAERAEVLTVANDHLADMLEDLTAIVPDVDEGRLIEEWLADWRQYLQDRVDYAGALTTDPDARLYVTAKGGDQITDYIDGFAADNDMPACSTPTDVA